MRHHTVPSDAPAIVLDEWRRSLVLSGPAQALARRISHRFSIGRSREDADDFQGAALSGLVEAAALFDPDRPLTRPTIEESFAAWAYPFSLKACRALCHQEQAVSGHMQDYVSRLRRRGHDPSEPSITDEDRRLAKMLSMRPDSVCRHRVSIAAGNARFAPSEHPMPEKGTAPSAEDAALAAIRDADVRDAIRELPHEMHLAMHLRMQGWTYPEIAGKLSTSENRIHTILRDGFARLRIRLAAYAPGRSAGGGGGRDSGGDSGGDGGGDGE